MRNLPRPIIPILRQFELLFSKRVWEWAKILLVGAILAPGKRTVTAVLRVMGLSDDGQFQNYHRVLNRAVWSPLTASRILLHLLLDAFVAPDAPIVPGLDDHIERRRGAKIKAKGIYRDPVRSSRSFFVKTSGLRWLSMMLCASIPTTLELADAVPLGALTGVSAATIAAVIGMPGFAATGLGDILGGLAVNFTSSLIDKVLNAASDRERRRLIQEELEAGDKDVQNLVSGAIIYAGPEVSAALPDNDRAGLIAALERAMRQAGSPLASIANRYGAALRNSALSVDLSGAVLDLPMPPAR